MKVVASLSPEDIAIIVKLLEKEHIACESRLADTEGGVETTDLLVSEADYDRACVLVEKWSGACSDNEKWREHGPRCPQCHSFAGEFLDDSQYYEKTGLVVWRCKSCGALVPVARNADSPLL